MGRFGWRPPLPLDIRVLLNALDKEIRLILPGNRLITPDEVRGKGASLRGVVRDRGWPAFTIRADLTHFTSASR